MDTYICMAESLHHSPETLISYTQYKIKSSKKKKKEEKIVCEKAAIGRDMGKDHKEITYHPQELSFSLQGTYVRLRSGG